VSAGHFPPGFLWGTATAGHQIEGGDHRADTTFLEHVSPSVFREPAGEACRGWELWQTDLDLLAGMGLNAYRFSVEWSRIEPEPGTIDEDALAHYEAVVDGCHSRGLAPVVTFSHFTAPHWFAMRGGWLDPDAAARFADYCSVVARRLGDRMSHAVTLNEPNLPVVLALGGLPPAIRDLERLTLEAAAKKAGVPRYRVGNVVLPEEFDAMRDGLLAAHRAARAAIKAERSELPVGFSLAVIDEVAEPGGEALRDQKRAAAYDFWLRAAAEDDFIGVQNYERLVYGPEGKLPPPPGAVISDMGSAVAPECLGGAVRYAPAMSGVPVFVTEHGCMTHDDTVRAAFIEPSLTGLQEAMADGVPVLGYCHWTLMDNFEWIFGYEGKLGLHSVDRSTFERVPKPSAGEFARAVAARLNA